MAQGRKVNHEIDAGPIERAVNDRNWAAARYETLRKLARQLDQTDSGRDSKALALTVTQLITECRGDDFDATAAGSDTPLAQIIRMGNDDEVLRETARERWAEQ